MVFNKEPTVPPFMRKLRTLTRNPPSCLRMMAIYFSYRDTNPALLLAIIYDGLPGHVALFCEHLAMYQKLLSQRNDENQGTR